MQMSIFKKIQNNMFVSIDQIKECTWSNIKQCQPYSCQVAHHQCTQCFQGFYNQDLDEG